MLSFAPADWYVFFLFGVLLLSIAWYSSRGVAGEKLEFLLAGRKVGLWLFIFSNVATWYGGILGIAEYSYSYGMVSWFTQGLPYYIFAALFALFVVPRARRAVNVSIPELIKNAYGDKVALLAAFPVLLLVLPAPYLLMMATVLKFLFQMPFWLSLVCSFLITLAYLSFGGLKSDIFTDVLFFFLMFTGFAVMLLFLLHGFGGPEFIRANVPATHLSLTGGQSPLYVLVWWIIAVWTFADPGFYQRTQAAKSDTVARIGILISVLFWFLFDFLSNTVGMYARAILPGLSEPSTAYFLLAEKVLSPGSKAFFLLALLATILSTLNSVLFLSGITIVNDILPALLRRPVRSDKRMMFFGMAVSGAISSVMAFFVPSVIAIWYTVGSIAIPGLILLILSSYFSALRVSPPYGAAALIAGSGGAVFWMLIRPSIPPGSTLYVIEPMLPGLLLASAVFLAGIISRRAEA